MQKRWSRLLALLLVVAILSSFQGMLLAAPAEPNISPNNGENLYVVPQFFLSATASSYEMNSDTCPPSNAIDGSGSSMWHTAWSSAAPEPHYLEVDLGRVMSVAGLTYLPRQNSGNNGTLGQYQVLYSVDGQQYQEAASGTWTVDETEKEASFTPVSARYVRLQAVNASMMSCAELNILVTDSKYQVLWTTWENAVATLEGADIGDTPGMYPQSAADALQAAIDAAELVIADPTAEEEAMTGQASALDTALEDFLASMNRYSSEQLEALISEAEGLITNTPTGTEDGQVPASAKSALSEAVTEAQNQLDGTPAQVHEAYLALEAAVERFEGQIAAKCISLAGTWQLKLGAYAEGDAETTLGDTCVLPGTLDENEKGTPNNGVDLNRLNRKYTYTGKAVYQKEVYIPANWAGKSVTFLMERTKLTRVWVNGVEQTDCTSSDSLGAPQVYTLGNWNPGEYNTLTVEVENSNYPVGTSCHMLTEETVTNWNGIIGRMELEAKDPVHMDSIRIYPNITDNTATVKLAISAEDTVGHSGTVTISAESYNHDGAPQTVPQQEFAVSIPAGESGTEVELTYNMVEDPVLWSEFDPALYHMTVTLTSGSSSETSVESFGMREFKADGRKFSINGTTTFMRGEGNSAVFPLTGYPYMTKEEWLDFFKTAQELGINFFRFHSWTPPEAAFEAADELGIYMQPELYAFGGTPFMPNGDNTTTSDYYFAEAERILEHLASHPSFVMMAWGNELDTSSSGKREWANKLREACRAYDSTRLYAEGTNNNYWSPSFNTGDDYWNTCKTKAGSDEYQIRISFSWVDAASGGHLESAQPSTDYTYEKALEGYTKPIMNHEAGQYQVLPNFDEEIPKYESGIFEARNLQAYRDLMEEKGLLGMNEIFSQVSARVSAIGYRADIETALRSPSLAGYQLLSIQDFPGQGTAHVGILNNFMEEKEGGFSKETYRSFNSSVVVLGMLPKLVWTTDETLTGEICVPNYGQTDLDGLVARWALKDGDQTLASGELSAHDAPQGEVTTLGSFETDALSQLTEAKKLTVEVAVDSIGNANTYDIWVYPADLDVSDTGDVVVCDNWDDSAKAALEAGEKVLLLPEPTTAAMPESLPVRWTTDYWSRMFHSSDTNAHTMGMYINTGHPIFADFPTEFFSDYQWFNLMKGSRALILDNAPEEITPLAWNIDHMQWSRKLGSLFEANVGSGKLVVCTFDLLGQMETYPEAKQLYYSILNYMNSDDFVPTIALTQEDISSMVQETVEGTNAYNIIEAENYSESSKSLNRENGTLEDGKSQTAIGGITPDTWIRFADVNFGETGAKTLILNGANANSYSETVEIHLDDPDGLLVDTVEFTSTGNWNVYKSQTYHIPRLTGIHDLVLVFQTGTLALNYLKFEETDTVYMDPYQQLNPESAAADIDITNLNENSNHVVMQNYVSQITNQVEIQFNHVDFGFYGSAMAVIAGRSLNGQDVTGTIQYVDANGEAQSIPFTFRAGAGEEYELSSETFWRQTVPAKGITGEQNLKIVFDEGTSFDFEAITFLTSPLPALEELLAEAEQVQDYASVRPLLYTEESWNAFAAALEAAQEVDREDDAAVLAVVEELRTALDGLELTGKSRSAYETIYARYYDDVTGTVQLERDAPDQVVGGFDKGELLHFNGVDFGDRGATQITAVAANGRADSEQEPVAKLRFYLDDGQKEYVDVTVEQTGGWTASEDQSFTASVDSTLFRGVKDITVELLEGAVAFNSFVFQESDEEVPVPTVTEVTVTPPAAMVTKGDEQQFTATVTGENNPAQTVTWTVRGGKEGTGITDGLLTVAADETAETLTVVATSTLDQTKSGEATVTVTEAPVEKFALTVANGSGSGEYEAGTEVTVQANAAETGMRFKAWEAEGITLADPTVNPLTITMPAGAVTLTATYEEIPETPTTHTITLKPNGGSVTPETIEVEEGETTFLPTPYRAGSYRFLGWFDANGKQYTAFTPITEDVTLIARWQYTGSTKPVDPVEPSKPVNPVEPSEPEGYVDVSVGDWYYDAVSYVTEEGLMTGVGNGKFSPDGAVTRAMVWTVLARMAGEDTEGGTTWYSKAQAWAMETGVSDGTNPMNSITREQLAAMLYRYEESPAVSGSLSAYPDANEVSDWAVDAMVWATKEGLINGIGGYLKPQSGATRAQLATMLMRFTA